MFICMFPPQSGGEPCSSCSGLGLGQSGDGAANATEARGLRDVRRAELCPPPPGGGLCPPPAPGQLPVWGLAGGGKGCFH